MRLKYELRAAIGAMMRSPDVDSPVYTFLPGLRPPPPRLGSRSTTPLQTAKDTSLRTLLDAAKTAVEGREYLRARKLIEQLGGLAPGDPQVVRMLAHVIWKTEDPSREAALFEARGVLATLEPGWSNDPETLSQWAAVHEQLWESLGDTEALGETIESYDRVFHLRRDVDSGTRLAYLLNVRASHARGLESVGDWVMAQRVRRRVFDIGERALAEIPAEALNNVKRYRVLAALQEAAIGLGDTAAAQDYGAAAAACNQPLPTRQATEQQLRRLAAFIKSPPEGTRDLSSKEPVPHAHRRSDRDRSLRSGVFISYSHKDEEWLTELRIHLKPYIRGGSLSIFDDTQIPPGSTWREVLEKALAEASVAVLLVSPDFLNSDFIEQNELPPLLDAAESRGVTILWVPVRPSSYRKSKIERFQAAHPPTKPLSSLDQWERDTAWVAICEKVEEAIMRSSR
jgi:hypothetical protein